MSQKSDKSKGAVYPEVIYVKWDEYSADQPILLADESADNFATSQPECVGIYTLSEIVTVESVTKITHDE